ncbi:2016_t:CDS:2 [Funneliformis geosporum]|nr:2016_t:CDS:2 [Funneliformis geosporum]
MDNKTKAKVEILQSLGLCVCQYQEVEGSLAINLLKSAIHVIAMDAFTNDSTITFLKQYRDNNIRIFNNKYQPRIGKTIKILYDLDKGSEAIKRANQTFTLQKPDGSPILTYKIADCYALDTSSVETYNEAEYQSRLSVKYFPKILSSLVSNTGASLEVISAEGTIANKKIVSNIIKAVEKNIKGSDAELIANAPDITSDDAEILKQISTRSFNNNMILQ